MKKRHLLYLFLLAFSFILANLVSLLTITAPTQAVEPSIAIINGWKGNGLTLRQGSQRNATSLEDIEDSQRLLDSPDDSLYVPGDNNSIARFIFGVGDVWEYGGLRVQTIPRSVLSEYRFPCRGRGTFTIGWQSLGNKRERACAEGVKLGAREGSSWSWWRSIPEKVASKDKFYAQAENELNVKPGSGEVIIQTDETTLGATVDVVLDSIEVTSPLFPNVQIIRAGQRYSYPQNEITPIDVNAIKNSPSFQEFMDPNSWLTPDLPQRMAQPLSQHLDGDRVALNAANPTTATQPNTSQNSSQTNEQVAINLCNSGAVTQPIIINRGNEPYEVWADFTGGQEANYPDACGRQYWVSQEPNNPNYGTKLTYLVGWNGACVVADAFEENPDGSLTPSQGEKCPVDSSTTEVQVAQCGDEQVSGGQGVNTRRVKLTATQGELNLTYDMRDVPDKMQVIYEGYPLLDTGFISGTGNQSVSFSGKSNEVTVIITGNQDQDTTRWDYTLSCPQ